MKIEDAIVYLLATSQHGMKTEYEAGTVQLFDRHGNLVDRIHAENIGCEYGEYSRCWPGIGVRKVTFFAT